MQLKMALNKKCNKEELNICNKQLNVQIRHKKISVTNKSIKYNLHYDLYNYFINNKHNRLFNYYIVKTNIL